MDARLAAALAAGRNATHRMAGAVSEEEYFDAASDLADAFRAVDRILTSQQKRK